MLSAAVEQFERLVIAPQRIADFVAIVARYSLQPYSRLAQANLLLLSSEIDPGIVHCRKHWMPQPTALASEH